MWLLFLAAASAAVPEPRYGVGVGAAVGDHRGLAGVLRLDLGPVSVEGHGGLATIPVFLLSPACLRLGVATGLQVGGDLIVPLDVTLHDRLRVGPSLGGSFIDGVGGEGRAGIVGDLEVGRFARITFSGGFRVVPGLSQWTADFASEACASALVEFTPSPLSAFQQYLGVTLFLKTP